MRRFSFIFAALLVLVAGFAHAPSADAATGRAHQANRGLRSNGPEYSINWSGYAVPAKAGEQITEVSASWYVPKVKVVPPGFSASWIGIGGYRSGDLIQAGTASSGILEGNYAWYEMLPENETPITSGCAGDAKCNVVQGDRVATRITFIGGDEWVISLVNYGSGATPRWTWSKSVTYKSSMSSADYIFEAPQLAGVQTTPANAPHAKFLGGASYRVNGATKPLVPGAGSRVIMADPAIGWYRTATPSMMAADGHFTVCAYKRDCPNF